MAPLKVYNNLFLSVLDALSPTRYAFTGLATTFTEPGPTVPAVNLPRLYHQWPGPALGRPARVPAGGRAPHPHPTVARPELGAGRCHGAPRIARVFAPDVYRLRFDKQRVLQPVPLANQQQQLSGSVRLSASSTRQTPVYQLQLNGSLEVAWLEALQPYALLQSLPAEASNKQLHQLRPQLRHQASSYLASYIASAHLPQSTAPARATGEGSYPDRWLVGPRLYPPTYTDNPWL